MNEQDRTRYSKFLSYVLRHKPESIGIELDRQGWTDIATLLDRARAHGKKLTRAMLDEVVETNPKKRFAISEDGQRIRASQGHSVEVELGYEPATPPEILFHGTVAARLESIRRQGLLPMNRHHVHLSPDQATAQAVGRRRGDPIVLRILAAKMHQDGCPFYLSANNVWLTASVPPSYIEFER